MKISRHHDRICPETNLKCTTGFCLVDGACSIQEVDKHCTCTVPDTKCPVHIELPTQQSSTEEEKELIKQLMYFIEEDGTPVDGFRFREIALELKNKISKR